ncbi:hypothetical protein GCM10007385_10590 [Tateyamaria omphalii]|uniref:GspMb/PilO family protein n=1 Tax=Tateyamaria omphalii TaxID=299262 RepID=UPI0016740A83|nr:GspMb/PilO family protein [Tateyamaria omphalii]GGX44526.1 hypothetical protein GCM10007385_10590 [Tateyamaria omphalii]
MTPDASRYLALALTVALMALAWAALVEPAIGWKRNALQEATRAESNHLRLIQSVRALEQDRQKIRSAPIEHVIWRSTEGRALMLDIQSVLAELAQQTGVAFSAVSPAQSQVEREVETLALALELQAPLDIVLRFIKAVEQHQPPLTVEAATLRRTQSLNFDTDQPVLQASFRIIAITLPQQTQVAQ